MQRRWLAVVVALAAFAMPGGRASAIGGCETDAPAADATPQAQTSAERLSELIEDIPCPDTDRVSFGTTDNLGESMDVLDPISDPAGGYLGVYHTAFGSPPGAKPWEFRISLAQSSDLLHWMRIVVLDPLGASMPTLRPIPGARGYLLAYEKKIPRAGDVVRLRYYPSLSRLLAGRFAAQHDLPRSFSYYNDGTPTILSIAWHGGLSRSVIQLGFHYETATKRGRGPDREALGTLVGFRRWSAETDPVTDAALDRQGLSGSHGDWRQFRFQGTSWRLYEGQTSFTNAGTWRVVLESVRNRQMRPLTLGTGSAPVSSSFANPVAVQLPAPYGGGRVLAVTMFLFAADAPYSSGELVFYQPI